MGAVYAAMDMDLARRVAIKVLLPQIATSRTAATRFVNEGRAAARIEGNHVARIFAAGRTDAGIPYMVLELLDGLDLADHLAQRGRLGLGEAVDILLEALQAVEEAHQQGIVHRDLKPGNLFLHRRSNGSQIVKVLDFGISKSSHPLSETSGEQELTMTQALLGSPFYMSPEQLQDSKAVDRRTDIWSLGVILYEMLAGAAPFHGETLRELFMAILEQPVPDLRHVRNDVPAALQAIVARCLERDLARRIPDAAELVRALTPFSSRASASFARAQPMNFTVPKVDFDPGTETVVQKTQVWIPPNVGAMRPQAATVTPSYGNAPHAQTNTVWAGTNPQEHVGASIQRTRRAMIVLAIVIPAALVFLGSILVFSLVLGPRDGRVPASKSAAAGARDLGATTLARPPAALPSADAAVPNASTRGAAPPAAP